MTATIISIAGYLRRQQVPEEPKDQITLVARKALGAFWAEVAKAIPARSGGIMLSELVELEPIARQAVRSWIYVNEDTST